jgi:hypothetical protein
VAYEKGETYLQKFTLEYYNEFRSDISLQKLRVLQKIKEENPQIIV